MPERSAPISGRADAAGDPEPLKPRTGYSVRRFFRSLGPGLITGAADDDPSGIATYSIAGAQLGTSLLWTSLLTWPLMAAVQIMSARIGMVTGMGLARALKRKTPRPLLIAGAVALWAANTINIGADLSGMADAAVGLVGGNRLVFAVAFGVVIAASAVVCSYGRFAAILKWLAATLLAYAVTAFVTRPDWRIVWRDFFLPRWPHGHEAWSTIVALLGTTISPYLFFWQASQEVEEEKGRGRRNVHQRSGASAAELNDRRVDVIAGTFLSNAVMFFVILSCAMTLHRTGVTRIETSAQAAAALRPLVGRFAAGLYALGIVTVGLLAIPTLAGASAYVFAETFNWRQGLNEKYGGAKIFYRVLLGSILGGVVLDFLPIRPVQALYGTAVINGVLAPLLLVGLLAVATDRKLMRGQPSSRLSRTVVGLTAIAMAGAAVAMFFV